jgi:hypothetical protein
MPDQSSPGPEPVFPGAPFEDFDDVLNHPHLLGGYGTMVDTGCPMCDWRSREWMLGCFRCFQLSGTDYLSHVISAHLDLLILTVFGSDEPLPDT